MNMKSLVKKLFIDKIREPGLSIVNQLSEAGLDVFTEEGILKEIPVVGIGFSMFSLQLKVREAFFISKLEKFFTEVGTIDDKFKNEFLDKCQVDKEYEKNIGEYILVVLERLDQEKKAIALGKIFKAYVQGNISVKQMNAYSYSLEKIDFNNIDVLQSFYSSNGIIEQESINVFLATGLISIYFGEQSISMRSSRRIGYSTNSFGEEFLKTIGLFENFYIY